MSVSTGMRISETQDGDRADDWKPLKGTDGSGHVDIRAGGSSLAPTDYSGNVIVSSIAGVAIDTMATGASKVRLAVAGITGTPGALYVAFGADEATAIANVNATAASEAGLLVALTPADGDEYILTIPSTARDGGSLAAGTTAYDAGNHEVLLNIVQGV